MATIIKIKNSGVSGSPSALATGELAYSFLSGTQINGGSRLYVGTGTEDSLTGAAANIEVVGGTYFTDKLDHTLGVLTASSALLVDANSKIDIFNVDNLRLDGNTLSSTDTNGTINIAANGTGLIALSTIGNITLTGASIALSGAFTHTGNVAVTGNQTISGTLDVTGLSTLATARISNLTAARMTFAGTSGQLVDSAAFTFNTATSTLALTGNMDIVGSLDVDNLNVNGNTISATNSNGNVEFTPNALGIVSINSATAVKIPVGNTASRPGTPSAGMIRYNTTDIRYEAYDGTNWAGLGGVVDVDQNTFIRAETSPGANNNDLEFYTNGVKRVNLDENGMVFTDTTIPLQVGNITISGSTIRTLTGGTLYLDPNPDGSQGSVIIEGNLTVNGTTTTINSTVTSVDDPIFVLGGDTAQTVPDGKDKGILFQWHNGTDAKTGFFGYDSSDARFTFIENASETSAVISGLAANVKFGNALIDSATFTSGNYLNTSVMGVNASGNVVFYNEDAANIYGVTGQVLQMSSTGVPSFGHIDCGTY